MSDTGKSEATAPAAPTQRATKIRQIAEARRQGLSREAIAARFGMTPNSVSVRLSEARKRGEMLPRFHSGNTLADRVLAVAEGRSIAEIAELLGTSKECVRTTLSKLRRNGHALTVVRDPRMRLAQVLALAEAGLMPTEIAQQLGTTRNAVHCAISALRRQGHAIAHCRQRAPSPITVPVAHHPQREPWPITVLVAEMAAWAAARGIAWSGDRASVARVNAVRNKLGLAPMWVNPKELAG